MKVLYLFDEDYGLYSNRGLLPCQTFYLANDWEYVCIPHRTYNCSWKGVTVNDGYRCFMSSETLGRWRYTTPEEDVKLKSFGFKI